MLQAGPLPPELAVDLGAADPDRAGLRPRERPRPPRHQAGQPDGDPGRGGQDRRDLGLSRVSGDWEQGGRSAPRHPGRRSSRHLALPTALRQSRDAHAADERSDLYALRGDALPHALRPAPLHRQEPGRGDDEGDALRTGALPGTRSVPADGLLSSGCWPSVPRTAIRTPVRRWRRWSRRGPATAPRMAVVHYGAAAGAELLRRQMRRLLSFSRWPGSALSVVLAVLAIALVLRHPLGPGTRSRGAGSASSSLIDQGHFRQALERIDSGAGRHGQGLAGRA